MLDDSLPRFKPKIQSRKCSVSFLKFIDDAQTLQIVLEATAIPHAFVERILSGMTERGMPKVVRKRYRLDEVLVQAQGSSYTARYLSHFQAVRQACAKKIPFVIYEDLRFVLQPAKRRGVHNPVAIPLEFPAVVR